MRLKDKMYSLVGSKWYICLKNKNFSLNKSNLKMNQNQILEENHNEKKGIKGFNCLNIIFQESSVIFDFRMLV